MTVTVFKIFSKIGFVFQPLCTMFVWSSDLFKQNLMRELRVSTFGIDGGVQDVGNGGSVSQDREHVR